MIKKKKNNARVRKKKKKAREIKKKQKADLELLSDARARRPRLRHSPLRLGLLLARGGGSQPDEYL